MIEPSGDRVLVAEVQTENESGIILPDSMKPENIKYKYIAQGPKVQHQFKEGDYLLAGKFKGTEVKAGGEEFRLIPESDILAVMTEA